MGTWGGGGDLSVMRRRQARDGEGSYALAAAGLADQAEGCAPGEAEVDAGDRVRNAAVVAMEDDAKALDFDQRAYRHLSPAIAAAMPASMVVRSVMPAGFLRVGRYFRKCTQRSRLTCSRRSSSVSGSAWSSTRRSRSDHSSSPWIRSAADCLPRLSPPAASPDRIAAIRRCAKGRFLPPM